MLSTHQENCLLFQPQCVSADGTLEKFLAATFLHILE